VRGVAIFIGVPPVVFAIAACLIGLASPCLAADDWAPIARTLPPPGVEVPAERLAKLEADAKDLDARIAKQIPLGSGNGGWEDISILTKAVRFAIELNEFHAPGDVDKAEELLVLARERCEQLVRREDHWRTDKGLVVRGYYSRVDGSPQPYGLVVPESVEWNTTTGRKFPLYVWLHGRNDKLSDLNFIHERLHKPGQLKLDDAVVLHPFGRSCLGWKSTAEVDVLEAIKAVSRNYPIDPNRVVLMGFSMGGAGAWHLGAHYAERWAGVHAGAGFVDVARYQHLAPAEFPPRYEQALWGVYDVPDYVRNLLHVPLVAYSGELDKQKQAADIMAEAFAANGRGLVHLIGPGMGHKYAEPQWQEVLSRMRAAAEQGLDDQPRQVSLQTRTLRYGRLHWVEALGLEEHWRDARIDAELPDEKARLKDATLTVTTKNVTALRLTPRLGLPRITIDGQTLDAKPSPMPLKREGGKWSFAEPDKAEPLTKRPGLQGPIDDVLMEPFLVVVPSGAGKHPQVERWVKFELDHFRRRWQAVYRGRLREKRDIDVTDDDIQQYHLLAWGDPQSNPLIARVADKLPVTWRGDTVGGGERRFDAASHVPLAIYPNPLNPQRYLVLNSGPTHREAHDRTNSLQNPKLPDWALVDVTVPPDGEHPGRVVAADFFDEAWQLRPVR